MSSVSADPPNTRRSMSAITCLDIEAFATRLAASSSGTCRWPYRNVNAKSSKPSDAAIAAAVVESSPPLKSTTAGFRLLDITGLYYIPSGQRDGKLRCTMPELPEVETIRCDLETAVVGVQISDVSYSDTPDTRAFGQPAAELSTGCRGAGSSSSCTSAAQIMIIHLGMSGRLFVARTVPNNPHLRVAFRLKDGRWLLFVDARRFGRMAVVKPGRYEAFPALASMGPDPCRKISTSIPSSRVRGESERPSRRGYLRSPLWREWAILPQTKPCTAPNYIHSAGNLPPVRRNAFVKPSVMCSGRRSEGEVPPSVSTGTG